MIKVYLSKYGYSELQMFREYNEDIPKQIYVEIPIETIVFPDKTKTFRFGKMSPELAEEFSSQRKMAVLKVFFYYTSPDEFFDLKAIIDMLKYNDFEVDLIIPYMPNARMDRIKSFSESFTLRSFVDYIKSLGANDIYIFDPHSPVTDLLLNYKSAISETVSAQLLKNILRSHINKTFGKHDKFYVAFPDEGSQKRYMEYINECKFKDRIKGIFVGSKTRDWNTGEIKRVDVNIIKGEWLPDEHHDVLIIDDICSKGGTFKYFIEAMNKEWGDKNTSYYLYVSHMEPSILDGDLIKQGNPMVKNVLTTDSLSYHVLYQDDKYKELKNMTSLIKIESIEEHMLKVWRNLKY